jgi:hypothetical protein
MQASRSGLGLGIRQRVACLVQKKHFSRCGALQRHRNTVDRSAGHNQLDMACVAHLSGKHAAALHDDSQL